MKAVNVVSFYHRCYGWMNGTETAKAPPLAQARSPHPSSFMVCFILSVSDYDASSPRPHALSTDAFLGSARVAPQRPAPPAPTGRPFRVIAPKVLLTELRMMTSFIIVHVTGVVIVFSNVARLCRHFVDQKPNRFSPCLALFLIFFSSFLFFSFFFIEGAALRGTATRVVVRRFRPLRKRCRSSMVSVHPSIDSFIHVY